MVFVVTDKNGREHRIKISDPNVFEALEEMKQWMDELASERTRLLGQCLDLRFENSRTRIELRRAKNEIADLQQVVDASISGLDP